MSSLPRAIEFASSLLFAVGAGLCPLNGAQEPAVSRPDPVARAVVQLLAIGPGERGNNRECSATGFLVNEDGYILTNAHVFERAMQCLAASPGAKVMAKLAWPESRAATAASCSLVALDEVHDLAVIKAERPLNAGTAEKMYVRLETSLAAPGTPVAATGHPAFAWNPVTQSGKIIRYGSLRLSEESSETSEVIVLDIELKAGNSGSPVYLFPAGAVIAVVERRNAWRISETVAVPIRYAIELMDRHGVRWHGRTR